jgi:Fe-Mn family superoxide dismutase
MYKSTITFEPKELDFKLFEPSLTEKQTKVHYTGHYLKYIKNFNQMLNSNTKLNKLYWDIKKNSSDDEFRNQLLLVIVELYDGTSSLVHNVAQIYNHELYWKSCVPKSQSVSSLSELKTKIFLSQEDFSNFYTKFMKLGSEHFGSGWLWIIYKSNSCDIITTQDAIIPINEKILAVIDLWEHAYYLDYESERKEYLEEIFKLINWKRIYERMLRANN